MKSLLPPILCLVFLLLISPIAVGQNQVIKGVVVDMKAQYPLVGASVFLIGSDPLVGSNTDTDGKFRLENIPLGRVAVGVSYLGYKSVVMPNILLVAGKETILNIALEESAQSMQGITVTAKAEKDMPINNLAKVSARTFSLEEVTRFSGGRNDVARLAAAFAGVSAPNDARNDIVVRGNSPTGLLWKVEDIPIATTNHFATLGTTGAPVNALNTNILRTSDFLTGAFPAEYGNANAAVFDVKFRNGNADKYEFTGQIAFTGVELMAEGPISRKRESSFLVSYRYGIAALVASGTTALPFYQDLSFKINLGKSRYGKFELFGLGGLSNIDFLGNKIKEDDLFSDPNQNTYVKNHLGLIGVSNTLQINKTTYLKTSFGVSTNYNGISRDNIKKDTAGNELSTYRVLNLKNVEDRYTLSSTLNKKFNARWSLRAGLLSELYGISFLTESKEVASIPDEDENGEPDYFLRALDISDYYNLSQLFAQAEYDITDNLEVTFGAHLQYHSFSNRLAAEPRLAASWQFTPKQRVGIAYGLHSQSIASPILFYQKRNAAGDYEQTNKHLNFMRSHHVVLSYDFKPHTNWRIKSEFYYQSLFSVPVEKEAGSYSALNAGADFEFVGKAYLENEGTGQNYGMELTVEKFLSKGYYILSTASLYRSTYKGSDGVERSTAFDNGVVGNLLVGKEWLFGKRKQNAIMLDTKLTLARGRPYTPIDETETRRASGVEQFYIENEAYSQRNGDYFRWDIKAGVRAAIKNTSHEWFVEVQNITDRRNDFRQRYNRSADKIVTVRQIGIYPVVMYRIRF